jgi:two-component system sensor histidine kinase YesM
VENDGEDVEEERLEALRSILSREPSGETGFTRLGLRNVHERIQLIFGPEYGLSIDRREGGGVIVTMVMPCRIPEGGRQAGKNPWALRLSSP